jgi:hypothetical protein
MDAEVTWIEVGSGRVFRVPADTQLAMGDAVVRNLKGERLDVDLEALTPFEVPRDEAFRQVRADLGGFLGSLGQGLMGEVERLEPSVRDLGDRLQKTAAQAQVADALDVVGDRLKLWANTMRGGAGGGTRARADEKPEQRLCPACFALIVDPVRCACCDFDLAIEAPVTLSPLEYGETERVDCGGCGAPILETARRCAVCGARQGRTL